MRFFRFLLALLLGFFAEVAVLHGLEGGAKAGPLVAGLVALLAAVVVMWLVAPDRRCRYLLMITAIFSGIVFLAMISLTPDLQPLTARVMSSAAAIAFALFGYARFVRRG
jgi:hypothetical protein